MILLATFALLMLFVYNQVKNTEHALDSIDNRLSGIEAKFYTLELAE